MTDRFDDLLIKARAEMLGKHTLRAEPSTDAVFEYVWDGLQKGFWGGAKRGYNAKRRMPGRSGHLTDDQMSIYEQMRGPKPKRTRGPRKPKAPASPITDESRMLSEQSAQQPITDNSRMLPENTFSGSSTEVPHLSENEPIDLVEGKDWQHINKPGFFENVGAQGPWGGANTAPENRQLPAPSQDVGAQSPPSAFEQGWSVSQRRDATNTADEWGNVEDMPPHHPHPTPPAEEPPAEESRVGLPWKPTLAESGPGSRDEDWNYRTRKPWGARSAKGKAMAAYYASLENDDQGLLEPIPSAEDEMIEAGIEGREKSKEQAPLPPSPIVGEGGNETVMNQERLNEYNKPPSAPAPEAEAPAPNAPTDVESATQRAKGRKAKRESIPQSQQTLFDAPPKAEAPAPSGEAVPYGEYTKHIQAASQGSEQSLDWLASNPASVARFHSDGLPKRIQDAIDAKGGSSEAESPKKPKKGKKAEDKTPPMPKKPKKDKKKSHDAFNSAWSVLKDPFANPFDNPNAFAIHDNFNIDKARRLPSETEMNSIRGVGEALSVSPDPIPHHAGMPRNAPLGYESMEHYYAVQQGRPWPSDKPKDEKLASANLSLLPQGMLKQMQGQQQADADYSLLPQGWQEGVVE